MTPFFRSKSGAKTDLDWQRLLPEAEVNRPAPVSLPALSVGPAENDLATFDVAVVGEGFDQKRMARPPKGSLGPRQPYEIDPAWRPGQSLEVRAEAEAILSAHNHPLDYMRTPFAWSWSPEGLNWAEAPDRTGGIVGLDRQGDPKNWKFKVSEPVPVTVTRGMAQLDARYAAAWPQFGAVAWAKRVYEATEMMAFVQSELASPAADHERLAAALWHEAFRLGAHLTEHRLRGLHGGLLVAGQKNRAATSAGADQTNRARRRARQDNQDAALNVAAERLAGAARKGGKPWTVSALAAEIYAGWKTEDAPSIATITRFLREAAAAKDVRVVGLNRPNASV